MTRSTTDPLPCPTLLLSSSQSSSVESVLLTRSNTLGMIEKRRPIREGRQIVEKIKRRGQAFSKKLIDIVKRRPWANFRNNYEMSGSASSYVPPYIIR